ncbi:uncharacterized protein LOC119345224 [Triticum dicoccoides]|uniref:uncharacterized protein LOC119343066 n=1 Tax=Triticum dicoccoides TaxID=85692 RepID=UPI00189056FB|nr:uncharacterized protein LOC119343066 [Triticum dicoccoides]XP_037471026.1 uncharacterized protein LOC119344788 [Triticum dicoccoides]XP_037471279.1 uncharacterized protein LOC119345224 [Triticum dicoccoides]
MDPEKVVHMLIAYCDPSKEAYEPIAEDWTDVQADNNTKEADDSYLCNPIPQNEHVGIDEEKMYCQSLETTTKKNRKHDNTESGGSKRPRRKRRLLRRFRCHFTAQQWAQGAESLILLALL